MAHKSVIIKNFRTEIPGELLPDRSAWVFPVVKTTVSSGKQSDWKIYVRVWRTRDDIIFPNVPDDAFVVIDDQWFDNVPMDKSLHGWIKKDTGIEGNINKNEPTDVSRGLNIGRKNATNVFTQALRDALGLYNDKVKRSHVKVVVDVNQQIPQAQIDNNDVAICNTTLYPPMLAQDYRTMINKPKITEDSYVFVQPKYNGVRAVATLECSEVDGVKTYRSIMYSRGKLLFAGMSYVKRELEPILNQYWQSGRPLYLDGEIYKHGVKLQKISGDARKESDVDTQYDYMIYDCFIPSEPQLIYEARNQILKEIFSPEFAEMFLAQHPLMYCKYVETYKITDMSEAENLFQRFLRDEFEGAMIRVNANYRYSYNDYHSNVLIKMKPTIDSEYKITKWDTGRKGKAAQALMLECETADGKKFNVTPAEEIPIRNALAKKMAEREPNGLTHFENHWEGKMLVVTYDELSKDGKPQRARTRLELRDRGI